MKLWRFVALGLAVCALASACGGGGDDGSATGRALGVAGVPDGVPFIDQDNLKFSPRSVTARPGETIFIKNSESTLHTVTIDGKNQSGSMKRNDVFQWTPPALGTYQVTCDFHAQMKATIVVADFTPAPSAEATPGS